jgi:hypothetical protein
MLLNIKDFSVDNIFFLESRENNIMNGNFIKILFSNEEFTMNGIYIDFPIHNYEKKVFNNKKILFFDVMTHSELISQFSKIENDIIQSFVKNESIKNKNIARKKIVNTIQTPMKNGMMKYYNYNGETSKFYIKISGVWETENDIGITYKLTQY